MNLFEEIYSYNNLLLAFDKVEENAGAPGVDNVTIEEFSVGLEERLMCLKKDLLNGTYKPDALLKVGIPKESGRIRWLSIPTVRDRIGQTSASTVLSPILDKEFEECSYAYRKNRSVQKVIQKISDLRDKGYVWVVDADISSFFDEVDHDILLNEVKRYIADERVVDVIKKWLKVDVVYKGGRTRLLKGLPQGSPISPLLSNLYLDSFDEAIMGEKFKHVRFADDFVILCKDKPEAEEAIELTEEVLNKLKLQLNMDKTRLVHFNQGFKYLGVQFLRTMVFRPVYDDEHDIEDEKIVAGEDKKSEGKAIQSYRAPALSSNIVPVAKSTSSERPTSSERNGIKKTEQLQHKMPNTLMARAFKEAIEESEKGDIDFLFHKKQDIEPSVSGNPLLRTLYLMEQGTVLKKEDERFKMLREGNVIKEIPAIKVDQIFVFGNIQITTQAMKFCIEEDIPIILLSSRGKYFGTVESFKRTNVALHKKQFEMADDRRFAIEIGRSIVKAKINNSKVLLQRYYRKRQHLTLDAEIKDINTLLNRLPSVERHDELIGIEGAASAKYFTSFRRLIGEDWGFKKRQKRPPPDPVNSLLSYGYTLLFYNILALVRAHGLHPYVAFLHAIKQGHPTLVSDLLEEFRAPIVDAVVLNLLMRGSLKKDDFTLSENDGTPCLLKDDARKIFVRAFEGKMNSNIMHEPTGYHVDYRRCIDLQVQALRKAIEGKIPKYEPMTIK